MEAKEILATILVLVVFWGLAITIIWNIKKMNNKKGV